MSSLSVSGRKGARPPRPMSTDQPPHLSLSLSVEAVSCYSFFFFVFVFARPIHLSCLHLYHLAVYTHLVVRVFMHPHQGDRYDVTMIMFKIFKSF